MEQYALNPWDGRSVARWAAHRVAQDPTGEHRTLWLRVTIDGPGYMLTQVGKPPQSGLWRPVAVIGMEDATRIDQRGPRGWPALCRLTDLIEAALPTGNKPQ